MASSGDRDWLNRLVPEHMPAALRFATRLTGQADAAEEVVQEALFRAARGMHTFRGESPFRTWFFRIVVNAFRDHLAATRRKDASEEPSAEEPVDPRARDPAAAVLENELRETIARHVSSLPPRQREVMVLVNYERLSPREAATVLGISEANVHVNLHHARTRLRADLAAYLAEK